MSTENPTPQDQNTDLNEPDHAKRAYAMVQSIVDRVCGFDFETARSQFKEICTDLGARVRSTPSGSPFDDTAPLAFELECLARRLGFSERPIWFDHQKDETSDGLSTRNLLRIMGPQGVPLQRSCWTCDCRSNSKKTVAIPSVFVAPELMITKKPPYARSSADGSLPRTAEYRKIFVRIGALARA